MVSALSEAIVKKVHERLSRLLDVAEVGIPTKRGGPAQLDRNSVFLSEPSAG